MSSDDPRLDVVRQALEGPMVAFHSALAATLEDVRAEVSDGAQEPGQEGGALGRFAAGRIDLNRFTAVIERRHIARSDEDESADHLRRASETLVELEARADELLVVDAPAGSVLRDVVAAALSVVGRAFGAARVAEHVRSGEGDEVDLSELTGLPFARWSGTERLRAPPLVVRVAGEDLMADALAEFLDGHQRLVLLVTGPAPPAPLARLVTPGTFVLQTADGQGLERLVDRDGPGIAALMPEDAARFVHDPAGGASLAERLTVHHLPEEAPDRALGGISTGQMAEQLAHLAALALPPRATPDGEEGAGPSSTTPERPVAPADRLAAWLLSQADLTDSP